MFLLMDVPLSSLNGAQEEEVSTISGVPFPDAPKILLPGKTAELWAGTMKIASSQVCITLRQRDPRQHHSHTYKM